jgi:hypothetical protein
MVQGLSEHLRSCMADALYFRDVVIFANHQGYNRIICETGCEELSKLWKH